MIDKNIMRNYYIHTIEKSVAENIGLLYRARQLLDKESLKTIYFSHTHSKLNYSTRVYFPNSKAICY